MIVEWTLSNLQINYQQLLLSISVDVNPQTKVTFIRNVSIQLTLQYNTLYNVSVTQHSICRQLTQSTFIELNYSKLHVCTST